MSSVRTFLQKREGIGDPACLGNVFIRIALGQRVLLDLNTALPKKSMAHFLGGEETSCWREVVAVAREASVGEISQEARYQANEKQGNPVAFDVKQCCNDSVGVDLSLQLALVLLKPDE